MKKRSLTEDLNEVAKKLQEESQTGSEGILHTPLHPQISNISLNPDSGFGSKDISRNPSSTSLETSRMCHENFDPMQSISEYEQVRCQSLSAYLQPERTVDSSRQSNSEDKDAKCAVKITVQGENKAATEPERPPKKSETSCFLGVSLSRKVSNGSITSDSDDFVTAPTSPVLTITRSTSIESTSSSYTSQEVEVRLEVDLPDADKITVKAKAKIFKTKLKKIRCDITLCLDHRRQKNSRIQFQSSPSSTPNSPFATNRQLSVPYQQGSPKLSHHQKGNDMHAQIQNNLIEDIVRGNLLKFYDSTDLDQLYPILFTNGLISKKDMEELQRFTNSRAKMNFFYILLLSTKGVEAYKKLFDCLKKEKEHSGHQYLVEIIERGLNQSVDTL